MNATRSQTGQSVTPEESQVCFTRARKSADANCPSNRVSRASDRDIAEPQCESERCSSDRGRDDHFREAPLGVAGEQRPDVLPHPRAANLAGNAIGVLRCRELEDQDQVCLVDLCDPRRRGAPSTTSCRPNVSRRPVMCSGVIPEL